MPTSFPFAADHLAGYEDPELYAQFLDGFLATHRPADFHERFLVEELAAAAWAWRRARAVDAAFWDDAGGSYRRDALGIAQARFQEKTARYATHLRCMAMAERQYYRALGAVESMRRAPRRGARPAPEQPPATVAPVAAAEAPLKAAAAGMDSEAAHRPAHSPAPASAVPKETPATSAVAVSSHERNAVKQIFPAKKTLRTVDDPVTGCYSESVSELGRSVKTQDG